MSRGVLVTGASGGIGAAVAHAFAGLGDRIAVHYGRNEDGAERTLAALPGTGHTLVAGDVADPDQAAAVLDGAVEALGAVHVLVNNAAIGPTRRNAHAVPEVSYVEWQRAWRETVDVNVLGAANLSYQVARRMIEQGEGGRIVNVGSRGAFSGEPGHPAYGASKAALHSLGQSLAVSLAPYGIAVASVAPGPTATGRIAPRLTGDGGEALLAQSPFGRVAEPAEVAGAVVYLASADAEWASGAVLDLNGASHLRT